MVAGQELLITHLPRSKLIDDVLRGSHFDAHELFKDSVVFLQLSGLQLKLLKLFDLRVQSRCRLLELAVEFFVFLC